MPGEQGRQTQRANTSRSSSKQMQVLVGAVGSVGTQTQPSACPPSYAHARGVAQGSTGCMCVSGAVVMVCVHSLTGPVTVQHPRVCCTRNLPGLLDTEQVLTLSNSLGVPCTIAAMHALVGAAAGLRQKWVGWLQPVPLQLQLEVHAGCRLNTRPLLQPGSADRVGPKGAVVGHQCECTASPQCRRLSQAPAAAVQAGAGTSSVAAKACQGRAVECHWHVTGRPPPGSRLHIQGYITRAQHFRLTATAANVVRWAGAHFTTTTWLLAVACLVAASLALPSSPATTAACWVMLVRGSTGY